MLRVVAASMLACGGNGWGVWNVGVKRWIAGDGFRDCARNDEVWVLRLLPESQGRQAARSRSIHAGGGGVWADRDGARDTSRNQMECSLGSPLTLRTPIPRTAPP